LATSTNEDRWSKVEDLCKRVTHSLNLLIWDATPNHRSEESKNKELQTVNHKEHP
jgi:hypothetical protein